VVEVNHKSVVKENKELRGKLLKLENDLKKEDLTKDSASLDTQTKVTQTNTDLTQQIQQLNLQISHKDKIISDLTKKNTDILQKSQELQMDLKNKINADKTKQSTGENNLQEQNILTSQRDAFQAQIQKIKNEKKRKIQHLKEQMTLEEKLTNRLYLENRELEKKLQELTKERESFTKQIIQQPGMCGDSTLTDYLNQQLLKSYFQFLSKQYEHETLENYSPTNPLTFSPTNPPGNFFPHSPKDGNQNKKDDLSEDWV